MSRWPASERPSRPFTTTPPRRAPSESCKRRTGLSHDLVARAFRHDDKDPQRWQLRELLDALSAGPSRRRTPEQAKVDKLKDLLDKRNAENTVLRQQLDGAASVVVALELQLGSFGDDTVIPIRSRKPRR